MDDTIFRLVVKGTAIEANNQVAKQYEVGEWITVESRAAGEQLAQDLSQEGNGLVVIQGAPQNDPSNVDAYLVAGAPQHKRLPVELDDGRLRFDTTANQYGAIGEAILTAPGSPALRHIVKTDISSALDSVGFEDLEFDIRTDPDSLELGYLNSDIDGEAEWIPDCEVRVKSGSPPRDLARYICEIKSGGGSFEREQREVMQAAAEQVNVLKIRVNLEDLPTQYSVSVEQVGDATTLRRSKHQPGLERYMETQDDASS